MNKLFIPKILKKTSLPALLLGTALALSSGQAQAAAEQVFFYNTYNNPAMMDFVKTFEIVGGGTAVFPKFTYKGTYNGVDNGKSESKKKDFLPYLNVMYRFHPNWVAGFDISNPAYDNMDYQSGSAAGIKALLHSKVYNAKLSYQLFDSFTVGLGVFVGNLTKEHYNFPITGLGQFRTKSSGARAGWNAGFLWKAAQGTFINGSYWSNLKAHSHGKGTLNGGGASPVRIDTMSPDTFSLSAMQFLSKEWLVSLTGRYIMWKHIRKAFTFYGMPVGAGPNGTLVTTTLPFELNYKNSWALSGFTRYQFSPKWAGLVAFDYNSSPQGTADRPVIFPASNSLWVAMGAQYEVTENVELTAVGGCAFSSAKINHAIEDARGKSKTIVPTVDLMLKYKI